MANTVVTRPDLFPAGTVVDAFAGGAAFSPRRLGVSPGGPAFEEQTVQSDDTLTFTTLAAGSRYILHALVGGTHRWLVVTGAGTVTTGLAGVPAPSWQARRTALGLSSR